MSTFGLSKTLKDLIVISALFIAPLAQVALAKEGRGKGGNRGNDSQRQQVNKSPARTKAPSSSRPAKVERRDTPKADSSQSRPSVNAQRQISTQILQKPPTRINQPGISRPRVQLSKPSPRPQIAPAGRQINVTKPSRETGQSRSTFQISRVPSGVEVRKPATANPSGQGRVIRPNISITLKPKPDVGSRIKIPIGRQVNSRVEAAPAPREKPKPDRTGRVITRIESPRSVSRPTRELGRDTGRTNDGRISPIVVPRKKPTLSRRPQTVVGDERESGRITDRAAESRISNEPRRFGRGRQDGDSNPSRDIADHRVDFARSHRRTVSIGSGDHDFRRFRPASTTRVAYEDRIRGLGARRHHNFVFRDRHHRLINRIIWPRYSYPVYYRWGRHYSFRYVYPFYHRRYVFVSLGGFWPDYTCVRYYWYPVHSFWWYGYAPLAYEVPGDTYNYYTYNYYTGQPASATVYSTEETGLTPVDSNTFADVREKLNQEQQQGPGAQTVADSLFEEGVKVFEQGGYAEAADKFAAAMALAPDDEILPFAYAQALFADGRYSQAADILRTALQKVTPEKEGVYYPRGMYLDENTLDEQIDRLAKEAESRPDESDLQLLLGYHWLGVGETEKSLEPLTKAKEDYKNFGAASTLLDLAEKIKAGETQ